MIVVTKESFYLNCDICTNPVTTSVTGIGERRRNNELRQRGQEAAQGSQVDQNRSVT